MDPVVSQLHHTSGTSARPVVAVPSSHSSRTLERIQKLETGSSEHPIPEESGLLCEASDLEYFDSRQGFSDMSEPEMYEVRQSVTGHGPLLPSGSEDYEDAPIVQEPDEPALQHELEVGTWPAALAPLELPPRGRAGYEEDGDLLKREISEALGSLSESSEEEVLTTRIVRRRVMFQVQAGGSEAICSMYIPFSLPEQAEDIPDMPAHSVTQEQYVDKHGHMVVKKVTRKVIRRLVSADGAELQAGSVEEAELQTGSVEGAEQEAVSVEPVDSSSNVLKRKVLKSEGDQAEVTFSEPVGLAVGAVAQQVRQTGSSSRVVQGDQMDQHLGDPRLAADFLSAQQDFQQDSDP
ncbi:hypothetical protein AGOR_G00195530 [Albula goreensis]|uniref:Ankyrin-2 n=1 Tax=Albula goreensis TaxID=1534307 RepID=A0A8T3CZU1_9TELE|nr:hypothetical protein AGOR_G00195530 [Albula goreensis]